MARTLEVVRQWRMLQELEAARQGLTLRRLAAIGGCSERTVRRDLDALEKAGFPLRDEKVDGSPRWRLDRHPLRDLDPGFQLTELCALYFGRALVEGLARPLFTADIDRAFGRLARALPPRMKAFLDRLPHAVVAKGARLADLQDADPRGERTARIFDAMLSGREVLMGYASASSRRVKDYRVHPARIVYADGGLYLTAFVPEYGELRTFALQRIRSVALLDTKFALRGTLPPDVFPHSLGVFSGTPEKVTVRFAPEIAGFVRERRWHASQRLREERDGSVRVELRVTLDAALRSWILGFGALVRVVAPARLAEEIRETLRAARDQYRTIVPVPLSEPSGAVQRELPFPLPIRRVQLRL